MILDFTEEELREAHRKNGECQSCGWHASFEEHEYEPTGSEQLPNEYWDVCKSDDDEEGRFSHRGCYIYPEKLSIEEKR